MDDATRLPTGIDTSVPHQARVWNYFIGGKDNYEADQEFAEKIKRVYPGFEDVPRHSRAFLGRAVRYLAGEVGIRQFLDIGTGLPTHDNTHEVAQRVAPESRIVYVDNDPLVLVHARALLTSTPEGACDYLDADVREPETILRRAADTLDFTQPVALMVLGVLGTIREDVQARAVLRRLLAALPSGSHLVLEDGTRTVQPDAAAEAERVRDDDGYDYELRTPERIARFFDGLELVEPGVVSVSRWRAEATPFGQPPEVDAFCGVALKR
ncbi:MULTISPECIES: SAM-dependent methyltransferase [Actinomadura]|uniref:SAM-dependent methyltransferase n=1 Tax=Actinomadura yumaensis TaxID=111807 RepID=A0ABW2CRX9_9ACTN|nr:SAM-dependent methyltransferase [Actinomadura sp. J1-007]MWK34129.1 SAM-dependent methyltransferase [Actinomadura sp. J1-007]